MTDHNCTWDSGSVIIINDEPKIITNCDVCGKELIEAFNVNNRHFYTDNHKERMEEYAKHQRPL